GAKRGSRPEWLVQFAELGAAQLEAAHGVERARVGLLAVGEEPKKGTEEVIEAKRVLSAGPLDFAGNVEGDDIAGGKLDVVVTDRFTNNIALKTIENTTITIMTTIRDTIRSNAISSLGGLLIQNKARHLREKLNQDSINTKI